VGLENRGAMARFTNTFTISEYVLETIEAMDRIGCVPGRLETSAQKTGSIPWN
jgi:hypothetical protein